MTQIFSLKIKISTPRFAETRDWYCDLFNLSVLEQWDESDDRGCILGLSNGRHEALLEIYHGTDAHVLAGLSLQFRVPDVELFPVPDDPRFVSRGPEPRPWGSRYLFLADPNGVSVVIFSGTSL